MNIKLSFMAMILLLMFSCGSQTADRKDDVQTYQLTSKAEVADKVIYLDKASFLEKVWNYEQNPEDWVYNGDKPCIIDFYADWCAPCRRIAPILNELAKEYAGQIYIYKIDTDKERELASVFQVRGIPSILYVPMNGRPQMQSGAFPKETYVQNINTMVLQKN